MTKLRKRLLLGFTAVLLAVGLLAVLEWRRRQAANVGVPRLDGSGVVISDDALKQKYSDPQAFACLCAAVQDRFEAQQNRFLRLRHLRKSRLMQLDTREKPIAIVELLDRVEFEGEKECKTSLEVRQVLGKPFDYGKLQGGLNSKTLPPFSKSTPAGTYRYKLEGIEELSGRVVLRVHFEPVEPAEGVFKGSVWVDPATAEPVRMHGWAAKLPAFVDRVEMLIEYGPSETGHHQMRRATMDVAGGFAFFSRHYRIEAELSDYRPRSHALRGNARPDALRPVPQEILP